MITLPLPSNAKYTSAPFAYAAVALALAIITIASVGIVFDDAPVTRSSAPPSDATPLQPGLWEYRTETIEYGRAPLPQAARITRVCTSGQAQRPALPLPAAACVLVKDNASDRARQMHYECPRGDEGETTRVTVLTRATRIGDC